MLRNSKRSFRELKAASVRHMVLLCPSHSSAQLHRATCYYERERNPQKYHLKENIAMQSSPTCLKWFLIFSPAECITDDRQNSFPWKLTLLCERCETEATRLFCDHLHFEELRNSRSVAKVYKDLLLGWWIRARFFLVPLGQCLSNAIREACWLQPLVLLSKTHRSKQTDAVLSATIPLEGPSEDNLQTVLATHGWRQLPKLVPEIWLCLSFCSRA